MIRFAMAAAAAVFATSASAVVIAEVEPNNTIQTAQVINLPYSSDVDVDGTLEGDGTGLLDYYGFDVVVPALPAARTMVIKVVPKDANASYISAFSAPGHDLTFSPGVGNVIFSGFTSGRFIFAVGRTSIGSASDYRLTASFTPEPATWAMMILGFGLVGFGARRSKARAYA